eukprot:SAG31_NODE_447_length_15579_cov_5.713871_8_plen_124_part_00
MGKVIPTYSIRTWKYKPLVDTSSASWWYDIILVVMVVVYAGGELLEMRRHVLSEARRQKERMSALLQTGDTKGVKERKGFAEYFEDRWNFVDLANCEASPMRLLSLCNPTPQNSVSMHVISRL